MVMRLWNAVADGCLMHPIKTKCARKYVVAFLLPVCFYTGTTNDKTFIKCM